MSIISRRKIDDTQIISALLNYQTQKECAEHLGITESTLSKRIAKKQFQEKLREIRKQQLSALNNQVVNASSKALQNIIEMLDSKNEYSRYNASCKVLSLADKYIITSDILSEIEEIKEQTTKNNF